MTKQVLSKEQQECLNSLLNSTSVKTALKKRLEKEILSLVWNTIMYDEELRQLILTEAKKWIKTNKQLLHAEFRDILNEKLRDFKSNIQIDVVS